MSRWAMILIPDGAPGGSPADGCVTAVVNFPGGSAQLGPVDGEVEDLVTLEAPRRRARRVLGAERIVQDGGHLRLGDSAMGAKAVSGQPRQVVVGLRGADARVRATDHHHVSLAIGRKIESFDR